MYNSKNLRKIIHETINRVLKEAMDDSFSYEELSSLTKFSQRVRYCKEHLGSPIGNGSSRSVFQVDDDKCLKLAKNAKGMAQNEAEYDWYAQSYGIMPKLYDCADDRSWILVEYVLPAKQQDFKVVLGVDFETYQRFVTKAYSCYGRNRWYANSLMSDEEFENLIENNEWFEQLYSYMADYQVPFGDLTRLANLGLAQRDGEPCIVILDSGLTQQIWDEFYKR